MITTFREISRNAKKSGLCPRCGKRRTRTRRFYQTLNPYNRNLDGSPKTIEQIYEELKVAIADWVPNFRCQVACEEAVE